MSFFLGFADELVKIAIKLDPEAAGWALSRGLTGGVGAGIMGASLLHAAKKRKEEKQKSNKQSLLRSAVGPALVGGAIGVGKGYAEKKLESAIVNALQRKLLKK